MINYLLGARCHMDVNVSVSVSVSVLVSVSLSLSDSRQLSLCWCILCTFHLCTLQGNCSWSGVVWQREGGNLKLNLKVADEVVVLHHKCFSRVASESNEKLLRNV